MATEGALDDHRGPRGRMIRFGLENGVWIRRGDRKPGIVVQTVISVLGRPRHKGYEFKACLVYPGRPSHKKRADQEGQ